MNGFPRAFVIAYGLILVANGIFGVVGWMTPVAVIVVTCVTNLLFVVLYPLAQKDFA